MKFSKIAAINPFKLNERFIEADAKNFSLIFYAFIVGIVVGLVGSAFRLTLNYIENYRSHLFFDANKFEINKWILILIFCIAGIAIALVLAKKIAPEISGSGVHEIEGALDGIRILRWKRVIPLKFIVSLFSLGSGLLLGREGPTIQIGGNIGKMVKDVFKQPNTKTNSLVSAGAAAGLASAFNAPLAGIVFVIEELHGHFKYSFFSLAAIMVASGTADYIVRILVGVDPVIKMTIFQNSELESLWLFIVLGLLFSFIGYLFNKLLITALDFFNDLHITGIILTVVFFGTIIALVGILYPEAIGGGYDTIRMVLDQSLTYKVLISLFLGRFLLTLLSYGVGVPGGIFAPLLALGVIFGLLFGNIMQQLFPASIPNPGIFAVAGMAGIFASTIRAPLTGLVLAVEMTSNYEMILPLIVITVTASLVTAELGNEPIYTTLLKRTQKNTGFDLKE